jgi:hypothetical protein
MSDTYTIPLVNKRLALRGINKINKKAKALNVEGIEYITSDVYKKLYTIFVPEIDEFKDIEVEVVDFILESTTVSLKGWSFLAVIESTPNGNIVLKIRDDVKIPERYSVPNTFCEHCKTNRKRKKLFLVYNEDTKETIQVGSTCIRNYLGFDASYLMYHAEVLEKFMNGSYDNDDAKRKHYEPVINLDVFLSYVISDITLYKYVSAKMSREDEYIDATGHSVFSDYFDLKAKDSEKDIRTKYMGEIKKIHEWVETLDLTNDYYRNISIAFKNDYVTWKSSNLIASIVISYRKTLEENKVKKSLPVSEYFGEVKERIDVYMTLEAVYKFDNHFGIVSMHKFRTSDGNVAMWTTNTGAFTLGNYVGKATIKEHKDYKGTKQTILTRCKIKRVWEDKNEDNN